MKKRVDHHVFSLTEMILVLAMLMILISLLLPVFKNVMDQSLAFSCQNNQRQIMMSVKMYAEDNRDEIPFGHLGYHFTLSVEHEGQSYNLRHWWSFLKPYHMEMDKYGGPTWVPGTFFQCPSPDAIHPLDKVSTGYQGYIDNWPSYQYNRSIFIHNIPALYPGRETFFHNGHELIRYPFRLNEIENPEDSWAFADCYQGNNGPPGTATPAQGGWGNSPLALKRVNWDSHKDYINVSFMDGRVGNYSRWDESF